MSQDKHVLHLRSNQSNNYPTSDKTISGTPIMDYGEIAINYAADNEFISIKNSNNTLTLFRAWPYIEQVILDNELVTASALTTLKESCGFDRNGKYAPSTSSKYISEAITITDALDILDENLSQTYTKNEIDSKGYLTEVPEIYPTYDWIWEQNFARFDNIPTSTSDLINDSDFITTTSVNSLIETHDTEIKTLIEDNEKVVATAITKLNESCGFNENAEFVPSTNATYISEATNVTEALNVLDEKLSSPESLIGLNYVKGGYADFIWDTTRFDNTNVNLTQIMYSVTGLKSGDEITVSFDYQISGVDFSSANASISVQSHSQWGYQTFNFTVNQNTSGHHSFTTHITTATTVIESTVMCPYIRLSLIGGDENSIIKISNFTIVKGNKEILNTISKSERDYHNGFNKVNTLSNISNTKRSVLCSTNVDQSFYLDIYNDLMPNGEEMHILVQNTNTTNNITIAFSTASHYVLMSGSSLTIQPSSWGEINVLRLGHKYYVRSI